MEVFKILLVSLKTFATRLGDVTAPNPNNKIIELELAANSFKDQIDLLVLPFLLLLPLVRSGKGVYILFILLLL